MLLHGHIRAGVMVPKSKKGCCDFVSLHVHGNLVSGIALETFHRSSDQPSGLFASADGILGHAFLAMRVIAGPCCRLECSLIQTECASQSLIKLVQLSL